MIPCSAMALSFSPYEVTKMIKISVKISSESRRLLTLANECSASVQTRRMAFADGGRACKAPRLASVVCGKKTRVKPVFLWCIIVASVERHFDHHHPHYQKCPINAPRSAFTSVWRSFIE